MIIPEYIGKCIDILTKNGYEACLVGGCVRDWLSGKEPHDYDMTTSALPDEMLQAFAGFRVIKTGLKHGTLTVMSTGNPVEITTYRIDGKYDDNRHPTSVSFTRNLAEDLSRRDFTINAMAYSPSTGLVDLFGGRGDIENRIISCVGNPDTRFHEDGLRIMRALRFSAVLDFGIDDRTRLSIHENRGLLGNIAVERIMTEFSKLITGTGVGRIIRDYADVLCVFLPECKNSPERCAEILDRENNGSVPPDLYINEAILFYSSGITPEEAEIALRRLKTDKFNINTVKMLLSDCKTEIKNDSLSVRRFLRGRDETYIGRLMRFRIAIADAGTADREKAIAKLALETYRNRECVTLKQLDINGADLLGAGIKDGRLIGSILSDLLDRVIDGELPNTRDALIVAAVAMQGRQNRGG